MIGKLRGIIDSCSEDHIILDVNGVGYQVYCCPSYILKIFPDFGEKTELIIETVIHGSMIRLYGFINKNEREWFQLLMTVQGVGAKLALTVLETLSIPEITNAIILGDKAAICRVPGIGNRVATRILSELRSEALNRSMEGLIVSSSQVLNRSDSAQSMIDAISALTNLGCSQQQATVVISKIMRNSQEDVSTETLIRLGLKEIT